MLGKSESHIKGVPLSTTLTPRQRAVAALEMRRPPGAVPTCELAFNLYSEWLGEPVRFYRVAEGATPRQQEQAYRAFARDSAVVYRQMDHCIISHWDEEKHMLGLARAYREETGAEFMLGFPVDDPFGIPAGKDMEQFAYRLADDPAGVRRDAQRTVDTALARAARLKAAGADVVWLGADYAMNAGPFMSPAMFADFAFPFLKQLVEGLRVLGLYVIKHSDGDLNAILDYIVAARPHAIHSLDSIAHIDIRRVKELYGDRVALIGNVPHGPLQLNQRERIEASARYCLEHGGVRQGGYIYSTSNAVFGGAITGITVEAYRFMLAVRDKYMAELGG
jgi:uroporphyrinogen decarboxylase